MCLLHSESVDQVVEKFGLQKITLLREISVKTGIQVTHLLCSDRTLTLPNGHHNLS